MELILVYAAVFVGGLIAAEQLISLLRRRFERTQSLNYRLKLLEGTEDNLGVYRSMIRERGLNFGNDDFAPLVTLRRLFVQSGLRIEPARIAIFAVAIVIVVWVGLGFIDMSFLARVLIVVVALVILPLLVMMQVRAARMKRFAGQLPSSLDVMSRSLAAGHPLPTAVALVAREMSDPIGTEFGLLSDEMTYGTAVDQAMLNLGERVGVEDLRLLAMSVSVQSGTGGNLIEILENLSGVIRERGILRAKVRALSAEGRFTAVLMSIFPFFLYFLIHTLSPTYFDPVWKSGYANIIVLVGLVIIVLGNLILYKLVNFDY